MTNKPMLRVERDLVVSILENAKQGYFSKDHGDALRALLKNTACIKCNDTGEADSGGVQPWGEDWCEICGWVHRVEGESCDSATERERKWSPRKQTAPVADGKSALLGLLMSSVSVDENGFYHLSGIHPGNFNRAIEASGATISENIPAHKSPAVFAITDYQILEAMRPAIMSADGGYVFETASQDVIDAGRALLAEVARLNGVKP